MMRQEKPLAFFAAPLAAALPLISCSGGNDDAAQGANAAAEQGGNHDAELVTDTELGATEVDYVDWGVIGPEPFSLDPIRVGSDQDFLTAANVCESLFRATEDFGIEPALAAEGDWTDDKTSVITVRDDVKFWNGNPLTSGDVVASLERQVNPEFGSIYFGACECVELIEATGDHEVTVSFGDTDSEFPSTLASKPGLIV